ncbi:MAG TPA: outer membrane protein assembly factor BamD [Verrucomicrobiae bacterium]|jgi:outer membrane protein assembly factor BamD|nr:outer membrane protein assembly factor BamD [Verrucomicrobiae bacterium]
MLRRITSVAIAGLVLFTAACTNKKAVNPLANLGSKQPDKVLFDKAMDAMHHNRFDVARLQLQTLINTYPDSEFVARAKLAEGDSWYAEGGTAALAQAEQVYDDFETFFPNMPEAAEAQLKIANIHYQQMEKADRDFTHAKRAEDEYRKMIMTYPDSKLVPEAKLRLLEVQEVLAEREFQIGRFYYLRDSYPASIARLKSLVQKYPLYSRADEALYLLGQDYEGQIARLKNSPTCDVHGLPRGCMTEAQKTNATPYIKEFTKGASEAYSEILTRYPVMDRADDAKKRLEALHQPVPRPTKAALAQNKAEEDSRHGPTAAERLMALIKKGPDVSSASKVGNPSLQDPNPVSASDVVRSEAMGAFGPARNDKLGVEIVKPEQPAPEAAANPDATPTNPFARPSSAANNAPATTDPNELKPNVPDANALQPNSPDAALPPPPQVNELAPGGSSNAAATQAAASTPATDQEISSSRKKKKKGLKKIIPF